MGAPRFDQRLNGGGGEDTGARALPMVHLASTSPRRRLLLQEAGIRHTAASPGLDDGQLVPGTASPEHWVAAMAYMKAVSAARGLPAGRSPIVLGADTVVVSRGVVYGQPRDAAHARAMISAMRSATHDVLTGVALVEPGPVPGRRDLFVDRARVLVGEISDDQIDRYLSGEGWRGKAGAYNLAERLEAGWPITVEGDPGTVMGLPIRVLLPRLESFAGGCSSDTRSCA